MARYRSSRRPQTPKERKSGAIVIIVMGGIFLLASLFMYYNYTTMVKKCTASATGTIVDVDSKRVRSKRSSHTEYQAHIRMEAGSDFGNATIDSKWSRSPFYEGDKVTVFYDPDDTFTYYVQGAAPDNGVVGIIISVIFVAVGLFSYIKASNELKSSSYEVDNY